MGLVGFTSVGELRRDAEVDWAEGRMRVEQSRDVRDDDAGMAMARVKNAQKAGLPIKRIAILPERDVSVLYPARQSLFDRLCWQRAMSLRAC
jgi:hypothetical protein